MFCHHLTYVFGDTESEASLPFPSVHRTLIDPKILTMKLSAAISAVCLASATAFTPASVSRVSLMWGTEEGLSLNR